MDTIPLEILSNILAFLSKKDLKEARLVSKSLAKATEPLLFDTVFIISRYADLEVARDLITSRCNSFVHTLRLSWEQFDSLTLLRYMRKADFKNRWGSDPNVGKRLYHCWMVYNKLRNEREEIENFGLTSRLINTALTQLPNLKRIVLSRNNYKPSQHRHCWCHRSLAQGTQRKVAPWDAGSFHATSDHKEKRRWPWPFKSFIPWAEFICANTSDYGNLPCLSPTGEIIPWQEVICALCLANNQSIKEIVFDGDKDSDAGSAHVITAEFNPLPHYLYYTSRALSNITMLEINYALFSDSDGCYQSFRSLDFWKRREVVARTMATVIHLEWLTFTVTDHKYLSHQEDHDPAPPALLPLLFKDCRYKNLRKLKLRGFSFTETDMFTFLHESRHLKSFELEYPFMAAGTWRQLLEHVRSSFELERVNLGLDPWAYGACRNRPPSRKADPGDWFGGFDEFIHLGLRPPCMDYTLAVDKFFFADGGNPFTIEALQRAALAAQATVYNDLALA